MIIKDYMKSSDKWIYRLKICSESKTLNIYKCVGEYQDEDKEDTWELASNTEQLQVLKEIVLDEDCILITNF